MYSYTYTHVLLRSLSLYPDSGRAYCEIRQSGAGKGCRGLNFIPIYLNASLCACGEPQRGIEMLRLRSIGCGPEG